jgi:hypothetical protein
MRERGGRKAPKRVGMCGSVQNKIDESVEMIGGDEVSEWMRHSEAKREFTREVEREERKNQFIEPNNCSRRSSTVHCTSDEDPALCEVACDCGRCGRMLKDPESMPLDRFSIRRPICAELLKNTCESTQVAVCQIKPHGYTNRAIAVPWSRADSPSPVFSRTRMSSRFLWTPTGRVP